jgi:hypothetical protein
VNVTVKAVNDPMDDDANSLNGRKVIADIKSEILTYGHADDRLVSLGKE